MTQSQSGIACSCYIISLHLTCCCIFTADDETSPWCQNWFLKYFKIRNKGEPEKWVYACWIQNPMLSNRQNLTSLVSSGFQDAADLIGAGRYGALQPTLLSHGILSFLCLRLLPTVSVHVYTVCVCMCASLVCVFIVLRSHGIARSNPPAMRDAPQHGSTSKPFHIQILPDAHRPGQYGCSHTKKVSYTYRHVHMHLSARIQDLFNIFTCIKRVRDNMWLKIISLVNLTWQSKADILTNTYMVVLIGWQRVIKG